MDARATSAAGAGRSSKRPSLAAAAALATALIGAALLLTGCGGGGVDGGGFTASDRKAAEEALTTLAQTSVYDTALNTSLTQAHVPTACAVHIEKTNPLTFRVFMTWVPDAGTIGGAGRLYSWLDAVIGPKGLAQDYSFHSGNESTETALKAHYGDVFAKPVEQCLVLQNERFGLLPS